jgi:thiosulfate dehydrogenase [quinone] large subunit
MSTTNTEMKTGSHVVHIEDSPVARALFGSTSWAWIWFFLRIYAGWEWLSAGWSKLQSSAWVGANAGSALSGFINHSLTLTGGEHPAVQTWYAWFLQNVVLPNVHAWSYLVAWGEFLVGVGLILGIFTGIAAFFGVFMNTNYLLAGSVSLNPILLIVGIGLLLAWKTAGWWGVDRWLLPVLGTPWSPGYVFHEGEQKDDERKGRPLRKPSHSS